MSADHRGPYRWTDYETQQSLEQQTSRLVAALLEVYVNKKFSDHPLWISMSEQHQRAIMKFLKCTIGLWFE